MKKRKPQFSLQEIKREMSSIERLAMTKTARQDAARLGFSGDDVVDIIQTIQGEHFYKSMTTFHNHQVWQDVYHVPVDEDLVLYIKFGEGSMTEFVVLSFKEQ